MQWFHADSATMRKFQMATSWTVIAYSLLLVLSVACARRCPGSAGSVVSPLRATFAKSVVSTTTTGRIEVYFIVMRVAYVVVAERTTFSTATLVECV